MIGGAYTAANGSEYNITYKLLTTIEETLEMLGIILFIGSLIEYLKIHQNITISLHIKQHEKQKEIISTKPVPSKSVGL